VSSPSGKRLLILIIPCLITLLVPSPSRSEEKYSPENADVLWTRQYGKKLVRSLKQAEREIFVLQYLVMGRGHVPEVRSILDTLKMKASNGVTVKIIADGSRKGPRGNPINSMLESYFGTMPVQVKITSPDKVMHSKVVIVDRKQSFIGSQNWSKNGLKENIELAAFVDDKQFSSNLQNRLQSSLEGTLRENVLDPGEKTINEVNRRELKSLPGIGPHFSEQILKYRREAGRIETINELRTISGIGKKRLRVLKRYFKRNRKQSHSSD